MKKEILHLVTLVAVIVAICFVGRFDYNEEILYHMAQKTKTFFFKILHARDISSWDGRVTILAFLP